MSRHPKSEIRKRRLPDRDQVEYFRLGYTSIFNVSSLNEQFLEFWHSLPSSFRDDDEDDLLPTQRRRTVMSQQHFCINEDEFKHNIRPLSNELSTNDLIVAPPHCLIRQKIRTAIKHYLTINHDKQIINSNHSKEQKEEHDLLLMDDEMIELTITDSPRKKRRRLNNDHPRKERKTLHDFVVNDSESDNDRFGIKFETNNTNKANSPLLRRFRGRPSHEPPTEDDDDDDDDVVALLCPNILKRKKRKRNESKNKKERTNDRPHVLFAANVAMPFYDHLIVPFAKFQERRKEYKTTNSKKEVNSVTKLTRNHFLHQIETNKGYKLMRENECVLQVAIFHSNKSSERFTKSHEYLILSTQRLSDLKDKLYCLSDLSPIGREIKNSYFFIEDTFYDDTRHDNYCRLSRDIINWSHNDEHWKQTGVYLEGDMQHTMIKDLNIGLGNHYLYVHQGDCQHVVVFTECRISTKRDCNNYYVYPLTVYRQILKRQKCGVCEMYPAKYVTYGDKLTSHNPFFFCQRCYYPFHYDKNGKLLYDDFQVFDYIHD